MQHALGRQPTAWRCSRNVSRPGTVSSSSSSSSRCSRRLRAAAKAEKAVDDEDLMQFPDRHRWYEAKFAADDMPDWNPARFVSLEQQAPGQKLLTLEAEISRERVPLRNAYKTAGQTAVIRVNGGEAYTLPVASPPHPESLNKDGFFLLKGDIFAGEIKRVREPTSVPGQVQCLVDKEAAPDVYNMRPDDLISLGPFQGSGLDVRSSGVLGVFRYPTIVIFASGAGIATVAALVESPLGVATHLSTRLRADVRLYYLAQNRAALCLTDRWEQWEEQLGVQVVPTTTSFMDAWDGDDTLVYDPESTAAFILTGGDAEAEAAALEVCKEAEITAIVLDSKPAAPSVNLDSTPKSFLRWMKSPEEAEMEAAAAAAAESNDLTD